MSKTVTGATPAILGRSTGVALFILVIAEVVAAFETTMAVQLLYTPGDFFTTDLSQLVWVVTAYSLVAALATGFVGRLGDQFGRRKVLIWILVLSAVGSLISAVAPTFGVLVAGRAIQGVSGAVLPLAIGIVRTTFPAAKVSLGIAVVSTSALIAGAGGMLVGGLFLDYASWHMIFWSAAVLALVAAFLAWIGLPKEPRSTLAGTGRVDYLGGLLFGASIAAMLYGLTISKGLGWTNASVLTFVIGGLIGLTLWAIWELKVSEPMVDIRLFKERKFSLGMLATVLFAAGPIGMMNILVVTIYRTPSELPLADGSMLELPVGLGLTATQTGLFGFVTAAAAFALSPVIGKVSANWGAKTGLIIGALLTIVGVIVVWVSPTSLPIVVLGMLLVTSGTGFLYSGMPTIIVETVQPDQTSTAAAVNAVTRTTFQAVAASLIGIMLAFAPIMADGVPFVSSTGFSLVMGVLIGTCVLAIVVVLFIPSSTPAHRPMTDATAGASKRKD